MPNRKYECPLNRHLRTMYTSSVPARGQPLSSIHPTFLIFQRYPPSHSQNSITYSPEIHGYQNPVSHHEKIPRLQTKHPSLPSLPSQSPNPALYPPLVARGVLTSIRFYSNMQRQLYCKSTTSASSPSTFLPLTSLASYNSSI